MSMKGCLIGNSHLAALASAASAESARWPNLELESFGAQRDTLDHFDVVDGWFRSDDKVARATVSKLVGRDAFEIAEYDFFVLSGLSLAPMPAMRFFRDYVTLDLPGVDGLDAASEVDATLVSTAMMADLIRDKFTHARAFEIARKLRAVTDAPIFVAASPRPCAQILGQDSKHVLFKKLHARGQGEVVGDYFEAAAAACCEAANVHYLPQPEETVQDWIFTQTEFMVGSVRLAAKHGIEHPQDDVVHGNANYGALLIDRMASALEKEFA